MSIVDSCYQCGAYRMTNCGRDACPQPQEGLAKGSITVTVRLPGTHTQRPSVHVFEPPTGRQNSVYARRLAQNAAAELERALIKAFDGYKKEAAMHAGFGVVAVATSSPAPLVSDPPGALRKQ